MIDGIASSVGGFRELSEYAKSISEFGKLAMVSGVVGAIVSPIFENSLGFAAGVTVVGFATWTIFRDFSEDFHEVDLMIQKHLIAHQVWLERNGLANVNNLRLSKV